MLHEQPREIIRHTLLPKENGSVTRSGISFKKVCFSSDRAIKEGWFEEERIDGNKNVIVTYDPRNCSSVFIKLKDGSFDQCFLTPRFKEYDGLHFDDVKTIIQYKEKQLKIKKTQKVNVEAELNAVARDLNKSETEKTKAVQLGKTKMSRHKGKRIARKMDKRMTSSQNAWTAVKPDQDKLTKGDVIPLPQKDESQQAPKLNQMQLFLMSKNKESRIQREQE